MTLAFGFQILCAEYEEEKTKMFFKVSLTSTAPGIASPNRKNSNRMANEENEKCFTY